MSELKKKLQYIQDELKALEERARKLKNQNLADIAASAHGRFKQLCDHPDLGLVDEKKDEPQAELPFDDQTVIGGKPGFGPGAPQAGDMQSAGIPQPAATSQGGRQF